MLLLNYTGHVKRFWTAADSAEEWVYLIGQSADGLVEGDRVWTNESEG
jgi:hypothetical protein